MNATDVVWQTKAKDVPTFFYLYFRKLSAIAAIDVNKSDRGCLLVGAHFKSRLRCCKTNLLGAAYDNAREPVKDCQWVCRLFPHFLPQRARIFSKASANPFHARAGGDESRFYILAYHLQLHSQSLLFVLSMLWVFGFCTVIKAKVVLTEYKEQILCQLISEPRCGKPWQTVRM